MTTDFRALAQELLQHARVAQKVLIGEGLWDDDDQDEGLFDRADKALATPPPEPPADGEVAELAALIRQCALAWEPDARLLGNMTAAQLVRAAELLERTATPPPDPSQLSDGYHTFEELYEHRHALTLSLMKARPDLFWFSRRHNDGELCFGDGAWFVLGAELPGVGAITYHLPMRLWEAATLTGATELEIGLLWDGYTATDVVDRLMAWTITPPPEPPEPLTNMEIAAWADADSYVPNEEMDSDSYGYRRCFTEEEFGRTIRAALWKWGDR